MAPDAALIRSRLLAWYDAHARELPWRTGSVARARGLRPEPYAVWLSEVMLQQTTTAHAGAYYREFLRRWPRVDDLAAAADGDVMAAWAGLGYYARARNLLACARAVTERHHGVFPDTEEGLLSLPGIGPYTAAAVAAIAFDRRANVVDGNVERVIARVRAVEAPLPAAKAELKRLAGELVNGERPGDWAQALMDLGAVVCRPQPLCARCPIAEPCAARASGAPQTYPRRATRGQRPRRQGAVFVLCAGDKVALVQRPAKGLLGGMLGLPTTTWTEGSLDQAAALCSAPLAASWTPAGVVEHVFTHFALTLQVFRASAACAADPSLAWTPVEEARRSLPSVFRKALEAGLGGLL